MGGREVYDGPLFARVFSCGDASGTETVDGEGGGWIMG